jgi:hypothetical protein
VWPATCDSPVPAGGGRGGGSQTYGTSHSHYFAEIPGTPEHLRTLGRRRRPEPSPELGGLRQECSEVGGASRMPARPRRSRARPTWRRPASAEGGSLSVWVEFGRISLWGLAG